MRVSNPGIERSAFGDGYAAGGAEFKAAHADAVNLGGSAFEITSARVRVAAGKRIDQSRTESEAGRLSKTDDGEAGGPKGEEGGAEVDVEKTLHTKPVLRRGFQKIEASNNNRHLKNWLVANWIFKGI